MGFAYRGITRAGMADYCVFPHGTKEDAMRHACGQLEAGASNVSVEDAGGKTVADEAEIRVFCTRSN